MAFRDRPNQGIIASRNNVLLLLPLIISATTLMIWLISNLAPGQERTASEVLSQGIGIGVYFQLLSLGGGLAFVQHYCLRYVLASGPQSVLPWRYADFLSYASDRRILQQVGGGYRFIHDKLRMHLANHPSTAD